MQEATTDSIDLRAIFSLLRRQLRLILATMAVIVGLAVLFIVNATPKYTASSLIFVDPSSKDLLAAEQVARASNGAENARVESEVEILRSPTVLLETLSRADLISNPEFGPQVGLLDKARMALGFEVDQTTDPQTAVTRAYERLEQAVTVRRRGLTYLINVSAKSESPETAALIANTLARTYIDLQVAGKTDAALASRDVIQAQIDGARAQLTQAEAELDQFIDNNLERLSSEISSEDFERLRAEFEQVREGTLAAEQEIASARSAISGQSWDDVVASLEDSAVSALDRQRRQLEARLGSADEGSQMAIDLREGLARVEEQLAETATQALNRKESSLAEMRNQTSALRDQIRDEMLSDLSPGTLAEIFSLQQEAEIAQRQYRTLLNRMRELEAQSLVQIADSRLVSEALPPRNPSEPNSRLILALAVVIALGMGIGLAVLNEYFVGGITDVSQLKQILPTPVMGSIPENRFRCVTV